MTLAHTTQRGLALIIVLWVTVLLAVIAGSFTLIARTENLMARHILDGTKARLAAEAAINYAVFNLRNPDIEARWIGDGRDYTLDFDDIEVTLQITDETGKIDLNVADADSLLRLFEQAGVENEDERNELVDAILDWRDPDDLIHPYGAEDDDYEAADYPYGAKDGPFDTVEELQQVMGMTYPLYRSIEPAITVFSGRGRADAAFAPPEALLAMDLEMDVPAVQEFIEQRQTAGETGDAAFLPDGTAVVARTGGLTYSIAARAALPNGIHSNLEATVRLGGGDVRRPFRIVRWRADQPQGKSFYQQQIDPDEEAEDSPRSRN